TLAERRHRDCLWEWDRHPLRQPPPRMQLAVFAGPAQSPERPHAPGGRNHSTLTRNSMANAAPSAWKTPFGLIRNAVTAGSIPCVSGTGTYVQEAPSSSENSTSSVVLASDSKLNVNPLAGVPSENSTGPPPPPPIVPTYITVCSGTESVTTTVSSSIGFGAQLDTAML